MSLDKEWSPSVTVSICCSNIPVHTRARWRDYSYRSYIEVVASNIEMCLLLCYVLQTISLKVWFIAPRCFTLSRTFSLSFPPPHAFYFLFPHLSLSGIYTTFIGFCFRPSHGLIYRVLAMQPGEMYCGAAVPPPSYSSSIQPASRFFILFYTKVKLYSISPRKLKLERKINVTEWSTFHSTAYVAY